MDSLVRFFKATGVIVNETALFLLIGFLLAAVIKVFVSEGRLVKYLGGRSFGSVLRAAAIGVPLPLCSCSVLPTALSMRRMGAGRGATASFLISTPETGVDSVLTTYALLDVFMTLIRPVAALATAVFTGVMVNAFDKPDQEHLPADAKGDECCHSCSCPAGHASAGAGRRASSARRIAAAFHELFDDLAGWLILGFVLSGLIDVLLPDDFFTTVIPSRWLAMLVMLLVGLPMYVCATASTPVAAAFLLKGLNPGAVVVFILAGPATNVGAIALLFKTMGRRFVVIYVAGISVASIACGVAVDAFYSAVGISPQAIVGSETEIIPGAVKLIFSGVLGLLLIAAIFRNGLHTVLVKPVKELLGLGGRG